MSALNCKMMNHEAKRGMSWNNLRLKNNYFEHDDREKFHWKLSSITF